MSSPREGSAEVLAPPPEFEDMTDTAILLRTRLTVPPRAVSRAEKMFTCFAAFLAHGTWRPRNLSEGVAGSPRMPASCGPSCRSSSRPDYGRSRRAQAPALSSRASASMLTWAR